MPFPQTQFTTADDWTIENIYLILSAQCYSDSSEILYFLNIFQEASPRRLKIGVKQLHIYNSTLLCTFSARTRVKQLHIYNYIFCTNTRETTTYL